MRLCRCLTAAGQRKAKTLPCIFSHLCWRYKLCSSHNVISHFSVSFSLICALFFTLFQPWRPFIWLFVLWLQSLYVVFSPRLLCHKTLFERKSARNKKFSEYYVIFFFCWIFSLSIPSSFYLIIIKRCWIKPECVVFTYKTCSRLTVTGIVAAHSHSPEKVFITSMRRREAHCEITADLLFEERFDTFLSSSLLS